MCGTARPNFFILAGLAQSKVRCRRRTPDEQTTLNGLTLRWLESPADRQCCDQLLTQHHYLHHAHLVGEHLRDALTGRGQWLTVAPWGAAALHLMPRDRFLGWPQKQRRQRLPLFAIHSRLFVLEDGHYPNLVSRFMKLMPARLSDHWTAARGHPVVLAETFVGPQHHRGTAYRVSGWSPLGGTRGWRRSAVDFYERHDQPKQVWVREWVKNACAPLRAPQRPPAWAAGLRPVAPRCPAQVREITSSRERLEHEVPESRRRQALADPIGGMLALIAMARFSGVARIAHQELCGSGPRAGPPRSGPRPTPAPASGPAGRVPGLAARRQKGGFVSGPAPLPGEFSNRLSSGSLEREALRLALRAGAGPVSDFGLRICFGLRTSGRAGHFARDWDAPRPGPVPPHPS